MGRAAVLAPQVPDPVNPVMPLVGPISLLYGAAGQAPGPAVPEIFDDAVASPHRWVSAIARILRARTALNLGRGHARAEAAFPAAADAAVISAALGGFWNGQSR